MSHTRFELGFPRHRKVFRLSDAAYRLWSSAIDYAREQRTNGRIDKVDLAAIPRGNGGGAWKATHADELVKSGLWERSDGGWQIHDFLDWQDSDEEANRKREQARERMRAVRANRKRSAGEVTLTTPDPDPDLRSGSGDSDLEIGGAREAESGTVPVAVNPRNLTEALAVPIGPRAGFVEQNRHLAEWVQPEAWPEVREVATALHVASGGKGGAKLGKYATDTGVKRVVELYAAGFTQAELEGVCARIVKDPWWVAEGGKQRSLGALTLEVVRRATAAPGAVDHAARKAAEGPVAPYHAPAKVVRETGPVAPPTEVKALLDKVIGTRP